MFVPIVPNTIVVNKTIVYSDTVLSLKDTGNNLKVTSIENVSEISLENCLEKIFESNPNVIFNTIQYSNDDIKPVNSNFNVKISYHGVWVSVKDFANKYVNELELFAPSYNNDYELECNSSIVNEAFNGKETEILKRIFVKISDCPEWSQTKLYEIRQNQLAEEQKIEDELRYKEMKKEKRLALTRKIFPFLKK